MMHHEMMMVLSKKSLTHMSRRASKISYKEGRGGGSSLQIVHKSIIISTSSTKIWSVKKYFR
jgi:hypothetical protein